MGCCCEYGTRSPGVQTRHQIPHLKMRRLDLFIHLILKFRDSNFLHYVLNQTSVYLSFCTNNKGNNNTDLSCMGSLKSRAQILQFQLIDYVKTPSTFPASAYLQLSLIKSSISQWGHQEGLTDHRSHRKRVGQKTNLTLCFSVQVC